jgi:hypothetical protein
MSPSTFLQSPCIWPSRSSLSAAVGRFSIVVVPFGAQQPNVLCVPTWCALLYPDDPDPSATLRWSPSDAPAADHRPWCLLQADYWFPCHRPLKSSQTPRALHESVYDQPEPTCWSIARVWLHVVRVLLYSELVHLSIHASPTKQAGGHKSWLACLQTELYLWCNLASRRCSEPAPTLLLTSLANSWRLINKRSASPHCPLFYWSNTVLMSCHA